MDATAIALKLSDCFTESPGDAELWDEVCTRYPYFAAARLMQLAGRREEKDALTTAALYKNDPYLFAVWVKEAAHRNVVVPEPAAEDLIDEPEAESILVAVDRTDSLTVHETPAEKTEDILALINELPNSNPITELHADLDSIPVVTAQVDIELSSPSTKNEDLSQSQGENALMVMMSFTDWLNYFKTKRETEQEEERDKKALKTSWQKEKLAAAVEEDIDEIPEPIFRQAMDSISAGPEMMSEGLAKILASQGKIDRAIDMYKKLSLRNPEKRSYFANLIENLTSNPD